MKAKSVIEHINEFDRGKNPKKNIGLGVFRNVPDELMGYAEALDKVAIRHGYKRIISDTDDFILVWEKDKGEPNHTIVRLFYSNFWNQYRISRSREPKFDNAEIASDFNKNSIYYTDTAKEEDFWKDKSVNEKLEFQRGSSPKESIGIGEVGKYGEKMVSVLRKLEPYIEKYNLTRIDESSLEEPSNYMVWIKKYPNFGERGNKFFRRYLTLKKEYNDENNLSILFNSESFDDRGLEGTWHPISWIGSDKLWDKYFPEAAPITESNFERDQSPKDTLQIGNVFKRFERIMLEIGESQGFSTRILDGVDNYRTWHRTPVNAIESSQIVYVELFIDDDKAKVEWNDGKGNWGKDFGQVWLNPSRWIEIFGRK